MVAYIYPKVSVKNQNKHEFNLLRPKTSLNPKGKKISKTVSLKGQH
jgi:hypothetical protein